jgi:hypothetical protein
MVKALEVNKEMSQSPRSTLGEKFIRIAKRLLGLLCSQFERAAESLLAQPVPIAPRQCQTWLDRVHGRRTRDLRVGAYLLQQRK